MKWEEGGEGEWGKKGRGEIKGRGEEIFVFVEKILLKCVAQHVGFKVNQLKVCKCVT